MARILSLWHKWSWAFHILVWIIAGTTYVATFQTNAAETANGLLRLQEEKLPIRMAIQEQTTKDIADNLQEIKQVQGKIFERINQIADRQH